MIITKAWLFRFRTERGAWTRRQLEAIGAGWTANHGWIDRAIGKEISAEAQAQFENNQTLREVSLAKNKRTPEQLARRADRKARRAARKLARQQRPSPPLIKSPPSVAALEHRSRPKEDRDAFFRTRSWRELRYQALQIHGAKCQCCGATAASSGAPLHVDHIRPRWHYPELSMRLDNLQILCEDCNIGKGAHDQTDWRPEAEPPPELDAEYRKRLQ